MGEPGKTRRVFVITGAAILLAALGGAALFFWKAKIENETEVPSVRVAGARVEEITEIFVAEGRTVPAQQIRVTPLVQAPVESVLVDVGQWVEKGQVLARLNQAETAAALSQARIQLEADQKKLSDSKALYERYQRLYEEKLIPFHFLDQARRDYTQSEYEVESSKLSVVTREREATYTTVVAPERGVISTRMVQPGELAKGVLFAIDTPRVLFTALIDERMIGLLQLGQQADIVLTAHPGKTYPGTITKISPLAQSEERNVGFPVWVDLGDQAAPPATGLTGYVRIRRQRSTLVIPAAALTYFSGDRGMVYEVKDSESHLSPVVVGASHNGRVEVVEGLSAGDQVVIEGQDKLRDRGKIVVRD